MSLNQPIIEWRGRRVWIVGASSGIGAALAENLAARGARLVLSARSQEKLDSVVGRCPGAVAMAVDVSLAGDLERVAVEVVKQLGGIDLAVFNAGTYTPLRAWDLTPEQIRSTIATNVIGTMEGVAAVLPGMLARNAGAIAIVGSVAGYGGLPRAVTYGPSKAALINFAEALHLDLAPKGVSVYLIDPGFVKTPLTAQNDFRMPALISPEQAARRIVKGLAGGGFEIHFPRRFTLAMKALALLPRWIYFPLIRKATGL